MFRVSYEDFSKMLKYYYFISSSITNSIIQISTNSDLEKVENIF